MKHPQKKRTVFYFLLLTMISVLTGCSEETQKEPQWISLFNETDLSGWHIVGGEATYEVVDGIIVGSTALHTENTFLVSDEQYDNFILELDVRVSDLLNSGIQIRSNTDPAYRDGRFHGYQAEIDPDPVRARFWSGGIYDEARRGWLYPLDWNPDARTAFKNGEWNKFRIEAIGNHIKTWINDVPVANLWDEYDSIGHIGLQVHSVGGDSSKLGLTVEAKNIRILTENVEEYANEHSAPEINLMKNKLTEKEKAEGWELLFDGKTSNGWRRAHDTAFPEIGWSIDDGVLIVHASGGGEAQHGGDIVTEEQYSAFDIILQFKVTEGANSGIKYFVDEKEKTRAGSAHGLEFQILDDKKHPDAVKYTSVPGSRTLASLYDLIPAENKRSAGVDKWNVARIVAYPDNRVEHWLNGTKVVEYERFTEAFREKIKGSKYSQTQFNTPRPFASAKEGHILLQDHGDEVYFQSIKIKVLE